MTLSDCMELFTREADKAGNNGGFNELKKYLYRVASSPIRNVRWSKCIFVGHSLILFFHFLCLHRVLL